MSTATTIPRSTDTTPTSPRAQSLSLGALRRAHPDVTPTPGFAGRPTPSRQERAGQLVRLPIHPEDTTSALAINEAKSLSVPFRRIGRVLRLDPSHAPVDANWAHAGSGVLVGPWHLLTASHVINGDTAGTRYRFVPAYHSGPRTGLGFTLVQSDIISHIGIDFDDVSGFDYVVCELSNPIGTEWGWMGVSSHPNAFYKNITWTSIGYPSNLEHGNVPHGNLFTVFEVHDDDHGSKRIVAHGDVASGWSGGPLYGPSPWIGETVVGVLSGGADGGNSPSDPDIVSFAGGPDMVRLVHHALATWDRLPWEHLGGHFTSPPAVCAWGTDRLDIFALGLDGSMFHKAWTGTDWAPSTTDWEHLGGHFTSPPAVCAWGTDRLDIFALGLDGSMFHKAWTGTDWAPSTTDWEHLGGHFTSPPAVCAWGTDRLDIFALGLDGSMFHKAWTGTDWAPSTTDWEHLGGHFTSPPAVCAWGTDRLDIFALGLDGSMFHKAWTGTDWAPSTTDWEHLGGHFTSPPAVCAWGTDRLDIFALGLDGSMFHKAWTGTDWAPSTTDWEHLGGHFTSPPAVCAWGTDRLDIFALGLDGSMFHKAWTGTDWAPSTTDWEHLGGHFTSPPTVCAWGTDRLDIFALGLDGSMFHKAWTGTDWAPRW